MKLEEYPVKGKDIKGIDHNGEIFYCFRCACPNDGCTEWRCSITGWGLIANIVAWEYVD